MCERYAFAATPAQMAARFGLVDVPDGLPTSYNVAPQTYLPVVVDGSPKRLDIMRWGLVPAWAKDERIARQTTTARAETAAERPAYRTALRYHRCLVPATGYYVWRATPRGKQPFFVQSAQEPLLAFAGLYAIWYSPDGTELRTYTILTCEPPASLGLFGGRMPVILPRDAEAAWLDARETRTAAILRLLRPDPALALAVQPVSDAVNDRANDGPALIAPPARDD
jgi:putative SOS response-associated peptidase YedK